MRSCRQGERSRVMHSIGANCARTSDAVIRAWACMACKALPIRYLAHDAARWKLTMRRTSALNLPWAAAPSRADNSA